MVVFHRALKRRNLGVFYLSNTVSSPHTGITASNCSIDKSGKWQIKYSPTEENKAGLTLSSSYISWDGETQRQLIVGWNAQYTAIRTYIIRLIKNTG